MTRQEAQKVVADFLGFPWEPGDIRLYSQDGWWLIEHTMTTIPFGVRQHLPEDLANKLIGSGAYRGDQNPYNRAIHAKAARIVELEGLNKQLEDKVVYLAYIIDEGK